MENQLNGYGNGNTIGNGNGSGNGSGNGLPQLINVTWAGSRPPRSSNEVDFLYDALVAKMDRTAMAHKYGLSRNTVACKTSTLKRRFMVRVVDGDGRLYRQLLEMGLLIPKP